MDRLEAMAMLVQVVESGSFSAASRVLHVPLATLSRRIADLEARLGTRLLHRTTRKLTLTDAGIDYVAAARRILEQVEEAERTAASEFTEPKGELVLTAPLMFGRLHVLPIVTEFLSEHPQITVKLTLADRHVDLIADHVDMAVRIGKLPDSSMVATQVGTMRLVTCANPHLLRGKRLPRTPQELAKLPCIAIDAPAPAPQWRFHKPENGRPFDVVVTPRLIVNTPEAAIEAATMGVGVTRLLHYQAAAAIERGELRLILTDYEPAPVPIHVLHTSRGQMPLKMRRFLDFAVPKLRATLK